MVYKIGRLSHEVDAATEDFKVFLNKLQRKGASTDVILCILYEAVNKFENIVKRRSSKNRCRQRYEYRPISRSDKGTGLKELW